MLGVGASDDLDELYFWSSRGSWVSLSAPGCQMVTDVTTPPGTICGTSFTPAVVSAVAGLVLSRNPALTASQVVTALVATARPVNGIAYGRVDPVAAFRWLGMPVPPARCRRPRRRSCCSDAAGDDAVRAPAPGQLFTRQTLFETGTFKRGFRSTFRVGRGRFEMQLLTPLASECSLSLNSATELSIAAPAVKNLISLSVPRRCRPVHRGGAVPRCPDSAVLARRHRDVSSRALLRPLGRVGGCGADERPFAPWPFVLAGSEAEIASPVSTTTSRIPFSSPSAPPRTGS